MFVKILQCFGWWKIFIASIHNVSRVIGIFHVSCPFRVSAEGISSPRFFAFMGYQSTEVRHYRDWVQGVVPHPMDIDVSEWLWRLWKEEAK